MLRSHLKSANQRRGNILIVTLLLLALFATIGLTIVYYTKDLSERQRINIEAQSTGATTFVDDGSVPFNIFLSDLIYDNTYSSSPQNAIWGHSLMRTMYGGQVGSTVPWNGVGTFHEQFSAVDRALLVNLSAFGGAVQPEVSNSGAYVPKNAPYTYPDLKDFYLASFCPATGEVLVPSFHRQVAFGSLAPNNPNWLSPIGKALTPRPRPIDNGGNASAFPYVPPNADGTYTGDVQNLLGSFVYNTTLQQYVAHNDSIWVDIGLPPMTLLNGKTIKPLVAPLIVDLDALMNYSVHGNQLSSPAHSSGAGFGTWEISLERALQASSPTGTADARSLVGARTLQTASGITSKQFNTRLVSGQQLEQGSAVPWSASGGVSPPSASFASGSLNLPGPNNSYYSTVPTYNPTYTGVQPGYDSTNAAVSGHPANYNPTEWVYNQNTTATNILPDIQQLLAQYGNTTYNNTYPQLNLFNQSATSIRGSIASIARPHQTTQNSYRTDPANANRGLLTSYSFSLDRPGLSPNFLNQTTGTALALTPGTILTGGLLTNPTLTSAFPTPGTAPGAISDFAVGQWKNNRAALGPIDLNRSLTDYRANTSAPLGPLNMAPANIPFGTTGIASQAVIDRQQFAMSIFARLVVATGAMGTVVTGLAPGGGESVTISAAPGTNEFNALRALAQLAANIVDYIDTDDISTAFVWNPVSAADPLAAANFSSANIGNTTVFGVEKPRLLLNEAYGELINDPNDPAFNPPQKPAQNNPLVRFWLEFVNPTSTPYSGGITSGPLGDGSVKVRYTAATDGVAAPYSAYQVQIVRSRGGAANVSDALRDPVNPANPGNVTGAIIGATPDLTFDFSAADAAANSAILYKVVPSNGTTTPNSTLICAAAATNPPPNQTNPPGYNPTTFPPTASLITATPGANTALTYNSIAIGSVFGKNAANDNLGMGLNHHVVLLRRLANPYMLANDPAIAFNPALPLNPYITVDSMDYVPATDQLLRSNAAATNRSKGGTGGYASNPASLGKVQPYAAWTPTNGQVQNGASGPSTGTYNFTFPNSLVLPQQAPPPAMTTGPLNTFGFVNSVTPNTPPNAATYTVGTGKLLNGANPETIMTPFDWLTHLDRTLINQTELLQVSTGKPHELTLRFIVPNALAGATDVSKFGYMATGTINSTVGPNTLYRALELLRIQPYGQMTGLGGRVPGKININTVQDKRVWDAVFDAQNWNGFTQNDVTTMWGSMIASRTPNMQPRYIPSQSGAGGLAQLTDTSGSPYSTPIPGASIYDGNGGTDRPFLPFGAPAYGPGTFAFPSGSGLLTDTFLRGGSILTASNTGANPHPYQQVEALRKITNNTTTVSHTFAVWVTVGYFSYNAPSSSATPVLGAEYYNLVPGDLRRRYFAVVDRSMIGLDPASVAAGTPTQSTNLPYFTTVDAQNVSAGSSTIVVTTSGTGNGVVKSNGTPASIIPSGAAFGTIVIGTGLTQETAAVTGVSQYPVAPGTPTQGVTLLTLAKPLQFPHWQGESVSNIIPGNPGPQANFNYTQAPYNYVVPFWSRLQ